MNVSSVSSIEPSLLARQRILALARQRFFREGYARVTMDALARQLGMSKKTLYQHFPTKATLAAAVMEDFRTEVIDRVQRILEDRTDALPTRLARAFVEVAHQLQQLGRPFLEDLVRYLPDVWTETERFRSRMLPRLLGHALREGQAAGCIRSDLPVAVMIEGFLAVAQRLLTPSALTRLPYALPELIRWVVGMLFAGLLTDAARTEFHNAFAALPPHPDPRR